ncbi:MAG: hypothetical protein N3B17_09235 [Chlorobi bacterium]|nr:hypothetical protein [Chlorobiota bacterium]
MKALVAVLAGAVVGAAAQQQCFEWKLDAGSHLRYSVEAFDTVAIAGEPVLYRHRREEWSLRCDSTRGDTMYLRQTLERFWAHEHTDRGDSSIRTTLPWVGKSALLVVTGRGYRLRASSPPTDSLAVVPGSIFGPPLFVPLDSVCTSCQRRVQWLAEQRDTLVEYAYPPAILERMYLGSVDSCSFDGMPRRLTIAETSRGFHLIRTAGYTMRTTVRLLANGVVEIAPQHMLPHTVSYAQQARFVIQQDGRVQRGEQRTSLRVESIE